MIKDPGKETNDPRPSEKWAEGYERILLIASDNYLRHMNFSACTNPISNDMHPMLILSCPVLRFHFPISSAEAMRII